MAKLLFWVLIVLGALIAMRLVVRSRQRPPDTRKDTRKTTKARTRHAKAAEPMVACAHCGVYLPRSDALLLHDQTWRCREHANEHRRGKT